MHVEETLRRALTPFRDIRLAVLFGSFSRGEARKDSDVDLGVLPTSDAPKNLLWEIDCALAGAVHRSIHSIELDQAPPLLRSEIARDGIVLLEREAGLWTRFRVRACLDWWEWRPYAQRIHKAAMERLRREARSP